MLVEIRHSNLNKNIGRYYLKNSVHSSAFVVVDPLVHKGLVQLEILRNSFSNKSLKISFTNKKSSHY